MVAATGGGTGIDAEGAGGGGGTKPAGFVSFSLGAWGAAFSPSEGGGGGGGGSSLLMGEKYTNLAKQVSQSVCAPFWSSLPLVLSEEFGDLLRVGVAQGTPLAAKVFVGLNDDFRHALVRRFGASDEVEAVSTRYTFMLILSIKADA